MHWSRSPLQAPPREGVAAGMAPVATSTQDDGGRRSPVAARNPTRPLVGATHEGSTPVKSFSAETQWSGKERRASGNGERRAHPGKVMAAELIVSYLEQIGVQAVFGVPGGAIEPIYDALARSARRNGPRAVVARHEAGAAFMADGYAR